jgi:hypothetical protein
MAGEEDKRDGPSEVKELGVVAAKDSTAGSAQTTTRPVQHALAEGAEVLQGVSTIRNSIKDGDYAGYVRGISTIPQRAQHSADLAQIAPNRKCWNIANGSDMAVDRNTGRKTDKCYGGLFNQTMMRPLYSIYVLQFFYRNAADVLGSLSATVGFNFTLKQYQTAFALAIYKTLRPAEVVSPTEMIRIAGRLRTRMSV